jgi:hypothetical protein
VLRQASGCAAQAACRIALPAAGRREDALRRFRPGMDLQDFLGLLCGQTRVTAQQALGMGQCGLDVCCVRLGAGCHAPVTVAADVASKCHDRMKIRVRAWADGRSRRYYHRELP